MGDNYTRTPTIDLKPLYSCIMCGGVIGADMHRMSCLHASIDKPAVQMLDSPKFKPMVTSKIKDIAILVVTRDIARLMQVDYSDGKPVIPFISGARWVVVKIASPRACRKQIVNFIGDAYDHEECKISLERYTPMGCFSRFNSEFYVKKEAGSLHHSTVEGEWTKLE